MNYYTSDLHFNCPNMITVCNRPFKSTEEMNESMIKNYNRIVKECDTTYILGDISNANTKEEIDSIYNILKRLNGKKVLIIGNHDNKIIEDSRIVSLFDEITYHKKLLYKDKEIIMCHYPIEVWDNRFKGSYHLHGHIHNLKNGNISEHIENRFNVGVDVQEFKPVTFEELIGLE